jgi:predicted permease
MHELGYDIRFAARTLRRSPGFALAIILTLGLGIGANAAMFSVINATLLQPLPYANGARVVRLLQPSAEAPNNEFSPPEIVDFRTQAATLADVVEYHSMPFTFLGEREPQRLQTGVVSASYFRMLGVEPVLGRTFREGEDQSGAEPVLLLTHEYWQREFGGDPNVIGKTFRMNDRVHTVVGVLPSIPGYPGVNDVYMPASSCPFRSNPNTQTNRLARGFTTFALPRPGVSIERVQTDLETVANRLHREYADAYPASERFSVGLRPLKEELTSSARPTLLVLLGTSGFLLLIVCANVANITLARLVRREQEMAVRAALGAGRGRLVRQLLTESTMLSLAGGALGLGLAFGGLEALVSFIGQFTPRAAEIRVDLTVLLFTLGVSVATGLVMGVLPALSNRADLATSLREGAGKATASAGRLRLRSVLIVSQVAVSLVLLVGAGLMVRSLINLQRVDTGFDPTNVLTARVDLNWTKYDSAYKTVQFMERLQQRLQEQPGVTAVGVAAAFPLSGTGASNNNAVLVDGRPTGDGQPLPQVNVGTASPDYFRTLGVPLVRGRFFTPLDRLGGEPVVLINRSMSRRFWSDEDPVGRRLSFDNGQSWSRIVGVVGDVKQDLTLDVLDEVYIPHFAINTIQSRLLVRSALDAARLERMLRDAVKALDPAQPVTDVRTLAQYRSLSLTPSRVTATLMGMFAALALVITAIGIAGVIAYSVSQRTQEIGIRMALGANNGSVLLMVMRQALVLAGFGLVLGLGGALLLTSLMSSLLFGVDARDPITFAGVSLVLLGVAAVACFVPARRATTIDPLVALRS